MSDSENDSNYSESEGSELSENEESVSDTKTTGKRKRKKHTIPTCQYCKREFPEFNTSHLREHTKTCEKRNPLNKCMWCGLVFTNRGNLASHAFHIHGDSSYKSVSKQKPSLCCDVCNKPCATATQLRYHIRRAHFNLQAKVPHAELKKVNQIWFEKVQNSNKIVEIKKTSPSTLLLRTLDENTGIKVKDVAQKTVDLSELYPLGKHAKGECEHCGNTFLKRDIRKHIEERHLNLKKFSCNNCNRTFKRSYQYLQHQCGRAQRLHGVKHVVGRHATGIKIANIESYGPKL